MVEMSHQYMRQHIEKKFYAQHYFHGLVVVCHFDEQESSLIC